jgi:hypothetical protein
MGPLALGLCLVILLVVSSFGSLMIFDEWWCGVFRSFFMLSLTTFLPTALAFPSCLLK